jgi:hypothetical protein
MNASVPSVSNEYVRLTNGSDNITLGFKANGKLYADINGNEVESASNYVVGTSYDLKITYNGSNLELLVDDVSEGTQSYSSIGTLTSLEFSDNLRVQSVKHSE